MDNVKLQSHGCFTATCAHDTSDGIETGLLTTAQAFDWTRVQVLAQLSMEIVSKRGYDSFQRGLDYLENFQRTKLA
jgi:hypothetical protein